MRFKADESAREQMQGSYSCQPVQLGNPQIKSNFYVIYRIRNLLNDCCYYGSTINVKDRFYHKPKGHLPLLRNNLHYNKILQNAWNKYGEENFVFEIVEEILDKSKLLEREQWYLDILKPKYNVAKTVGGGPLFKNKKHSDKTKTILSEKAKIVQKGRIPWNKGKICSYISESNKKRKTIHSEETKKKISKSVKEYYNSRLMFKVNNELS